MVLGCQEAIWLVIVSSITTKSFHLSTYPSKPSYRSLKYHSSLYILWRKWSLMCHPFWWWNKICCFQLRIFQIPWSRWYVCHFFKSYWGTVGKEVIAMVQSFFASGLMLKEMNHTFITLIPKTPNPSIVNNFRPISLCNVSYKIISKTLANRLKILLPKLITPWQATSVPGRNI